MGGSCRQLLTVVGLPWATFQRWSARLRNAEPLAQTPGPRKEAPLNLDALMGEVQQMEHSRRRSFGTGQLYEAHKDQISRRGLQKLVKIERCRINAQKRAHLRKITWRLPGLTWAMDGTHIGPVQLQQVQDLASRYKFEPFLAPTLSGKQVAEHLEKIIDLHGPPLILKRDRGSNLRDASVQAVLERHLIIPLDSPRRYPQYNGAIEYAQREIKGILEDRYRVADMALANHAVAAHELNHRPRPCLDGRTACTVFEAGREAMKVYTRPKRKEVIDWIATEALAILRTEELNGAGARDAAWRRAVETWLHLMAQSPSRWTGKCYPVSRKIGLNISWCVHRTGGSWRTIAYGVISAMDCFSAPIGEWINGLSHGKIPAPLADKLADIIALAGQNGITQGTAIPAAQAKACCSVAKGQL